MADRVHPAPPPPSLTSSPPHHQPSPPPPTETTPLQQQQQQAQAQHPSFARPAAPPPGTYIVQVPKDQILRVPPPDRARRYKKLSSRPARRRALRRACCCACAVLLAVLLAAAAFVAAVYLVYRPRSPSFSVPSLSIHGLLNSTSLSGAAATTTTTLSPRLDATVRADNARNKKVGVEYRGGGAVVVSYDSGNARLAVGPWPAFRQPARNVTEFRVGMAGDGVRLTEDQAARIGRELAAGAVPLQVEATVPVRLRFGGVLRTWTVDVRARCDVAVDRLDGDAVAVNRGCRVKVRPLWWWW